MKLKRNKRIFRAFLMTIVALLAAGCGQVPQNGNGNQNRNSAANVNQNSAVSVNQNMAGTPETALDAATLATLAGACDGLTIDDKVSLVDEKLKEEVGKDTVMGGYVKVQARKIGNASVEVLIEGRVRHRDKMNTLKDIVKAVFKSGCVQRVVFVPPGTIPLQSEKGIRYDGGFVWGCQAPEVLCPNGECKEQC